MTPQLLRATLFHTPRDPFREERALEAYADGALLIEDGAINGCGDYGAIRRIYPDVPVRDLRGGYLLPGFVDTHIHFPQVRVLGGLGYTLLDWLEHNTLPEEARLADSDYAAAIAREFVPALAAHGTTTALVFGSHFSHATALLFEAAEAAGLRVASGLVLSDRMLREELHQTPEQAYRESTELIRRFHGKGRLLYAVTPRFALSSSEAMLEVCQTLLAEHEGLRFTTHWNENVREIVEVMRRFPWAEDYLSVYERYHLTGRNAVLAHSVHSTPAQLERLAATGGAVAHCPCSNAALGSGFFPMQRHLQAGVRFALGTDVGGGTGFSLLKEGLQAYLLQRLAPEPYLLRPDQLLYLATRAGAEAMGLQEETGDFRPGKSADYVYIRPAACCPLANALDQAGSLERVLGWLFTLAGADHIEEVAVAGRVIHRRECKPLA
ncbi:MAG: guanine deaminase [Acidobacteria bacterium]|nr:guanine deaminase [Acidobacteriota bacterium]